MKEKEILNTVKDPDIHVVNNVSDLIKKINQDAMDVLFISDKKNLPKNWEIRHCYRTDFVLATKKDIKKICKKDKKITAPKDIQWCDFFVYNERKNIILPFKKNDYLMDKDGYTTFDGKQYFYYDNDGNELGAF